MPCPGRVYAGFVLLIASAGTKLAGAQCEGLVDILQDRRSGASVETREALAYEHFCEQSYKLDEAEIQDGSFSYYGIITAEGSPRYTHERIESFCREKKHYKYYHLADSHEEIEFNTDAGDLYFECLKMAKRGVVFDVEELGDDRLMVNMRAATGAEERVAVVAFRGEPGGCELVDADGLRHGSVAPGETIPFLGNRNLFLECDRALRKHTVVTVNTVEGDPFVLSVPPSVASPPQVSAPQIRVSAESIRVVRTCDTGSQARNAELAWSIAVGGQVVSAEGLTRIPPGSTYPLDGAQIVVPFSPSLSIPIEVEMSEYDNSGRDVGNSDDVNETITLDDFGDLRAHTRTVRVWPDVERCDVRVRISAEID